MMRKTLLAIFGCWLLINGCINHGNAQAGIAVRLLNYTLQNQQGNVPLGYTITISAEVQNTDSANSFGGTVDFGLRNYTQNLSSVSGIFNKPYYSSQQISLGPGEKIPAIFSVDIEHPYFSPGPDVVVVWPIAQSPSTDSVVIYLNIFNPSGIYTDKRLEFEYAVAEDKILLLNLPSEIVFKQVRIYTVLGQEISRIAPPVFSEIPIGILPKGIYLCELIANDNRRNVIKFFR